MAKLRNFVEGTIFGHLADALKAGYPVDYKRGMEQRLLGKRRECGLGKREEMTSHFIPPICDFLG